MPDQNKEIVLKLIIDGKEAYSTLKITDAEIKKIRETAGLLDDTFTKSYQAITKELQKFNVVNEQSIESITKWLLTQDLTSEQIQNTITQLQTENKTLNVNSIEWKNNFNQIQLLQTAYQNVISQHTNLGGAQYQALAGTQKMNMAMMQTGYIMNDAQMFLVNFRMGLMGIANNIPMVVQLLAEARKEITTMGGSIKDVLIKSLTGAGGLMLAINGVMFLMQLLPGLFSKTTESIEDQKAAVDALRDSYSRLTKAEIENRIVDYKSQLAELESKHNKTSEMRQIGGIKSDKYERVQLTLEERFGDDLARYNSLNQQIKLLEEINLNRGIEEEKTIEIAHWREKIEKMNNDPESKNYWKNLVTDAISYEDAVNKLESAIDSYQKKTRNSDSKNDSKILGKPLEGEIPVRGLDTFFSGIKVPEIEQEKMAEMELRRLKIESIEDEFERKRELTDWELQNETIKYYNYENFEEIRTELEKQHSITRKEIALDEANFKVETTLNTLSMLQSAFAEHTAIAKAAAVASTIIQTYLAATAALAPPPIGAGPLLGPILAGITIVSGLGNAAKIMSTETPGYAEGGLLPKGRTGFIEGWHNEIIAPEKTFVDVMKTNILPQLYAPANSGINYLNRFVDEIKSWQKDLAFSFELEGNKLVAATDRSRNLQTELEY